MIGKGNRWTWILSFFEPDAETGQEYDYVFNQLIGPDEINYAPWVKALVGGSCPHELVDMPLPEARRFRLVAIDPPFLLYAELREH